MSSEYQTPPSLPIRTCDGVGRVDGDRVVVGMEVAAEVLPRLAAIGRAEDAARAGAVVEQAEGVHDVAVGRVDADDVVVEALRAAVVGDVVAARCAVRQELPRTAVDGLPDLRRLILAVDRPLEARVEHRRVTGRMRDAEREPGAAAGPEGGVGRDAGHELGPVLAAVGRAVDRVAPERGVQHVRVAADRPRCRSRRGARS